MSFLIAEHTPLGPTAPTLVMLHGTGGDETEMADFGRRLTARANILAPRGKEPESGMNRWFRRHAEGVFDEPNLIERTHELADWLLETLPDRPRFACGYSNGANIAAAVLLLRPEVLHGAALVAPMVPLTPEALPDLTGRPILLVSGENDPIAPRFNVQTLATMLQTSGAEVEHHWHSGGHAPSALEWNIVAAWLARHLPAPT